VLLQLLKVCGQSLYPAYQDGDFVLVSRLPILVRGIRPGDAVVFRHPRLGKLIKLVLRLEADGRMVYLIGLDENSVDSRRFGAIPRADILGKVIRHIPKKAA
jgi:signal peptidase I